MPDHGQWTDQKVEVIIGVMLRVVFMWVIVALAAEMLFNGVTGRI